MFPVLGLCAALSAPAQAGTWSESPPDPEVITDLSAYTVRQGQWRLGLLNQDYGLLDNASVGTSTLLWPLAVPNLHAKVRGIQTPRLDLSIQGGWYSLDLERLLGIPGGKAVYTPVGWTASWKASPAYTVHLGTDWYVMSLEGSLSAAQIGEAVAALAGAELDADLREALGESAGVYAGADLTLTRLRLALDYRLNRRDSIVFTANSALRLDGLVAAGVEATGEGGESVAVGASARIRLPLSKTLPTTIAVGWQWSWRRAHLRVGLPLSNNANGLFAWGSIIQLEALLGPVPEPDPAAHEAAFPRYRGGTEPGAASG